MSRKAYINKGSDFYNKHGNLKGEYSYSGGSGMVARGQGTVYERRGRNMVKVRKSIYGKEAIPVAAPAPAPAAPPPPAPTPAPPPPPKPAPVVHSSEIKQAKDRVNAYENGKSPSEQAQANVQSSFIKDTGSNFNKQFDFSSNSFEVKESPKPNEQAQAAQNLAQNFISKYSQYKSNN